MATIKGRKISEETNVATSLQGDELIPFGKKDKSGGVISTETLIDKAKKALFVDMWTSIPQLQYNNETDCFIAKYIMDGVEYGFDDITYKEALFMWSRKCVGGDWSGACHGIERINIHPLNYFNPNVGRSSLFCAYNSKIKVLACAQSGDNYIPTDVLSNINNCTNLRVILGRFNIVQQSINLAKLPKLEEIRVLFTGNSTQSTPSLTLADSPNLSLASLRYTTDNSVNNKSATITVHPDVYAKLTDETNTEWHEVLTDAEAKQISFATA